MDSARTTAGETPAVPSARVPHFIPLAVAYIDEAILAKLSKTPTVAVDSVRMSMKKMYYDSSKAIRELGLPQSPVKGALAKAIDWFKSNGYVET